MIGEKTKTGDSYQTAQETDEERKTSLEKMVATELLKLAMEKDKERKARLKKMVATTQLRLVPETEDERRSRLEYLSDNSIYIPNNLYLILPYFIDQSPRRLIISFCRYLRRLFEDGDYSRAASIKEYCHTTRKMVPITRRASSVLESI